MFVLVLELKLLGDGVCVLFDCMGYVCIRSLREKDLFMPLMYECVCEGEMFVFMSGTNSAFINSDYYPGDITVFPL